MYVFFVCVQEEFEAYKIIIRMFSEELNKYMILVFTGLDTYDDEESIGNFYLDECP